MTPQYLQTRSDTTTVLKVSGLTSTDSVLASARSASGDVTAATVATVSADDAVVYALTLPVLSTGRYELDVVSIAADGACSQLVRAILQVREGIASVAAAATTYEVVASTEVASISVTLVAGSGGGCSCSADDDSTASSGWVEISDLNEVTSAGSYKLDVSDRTYCNYPNPGAGNIARVWIVGLSGSTVAGTTQLAAIEGDAPCCNSNVHAGDEVSSNTLLTLLGMPAGYYVILSVDTLGYVYNS